MGYRLRTLSSGYSRTLIVWVLDGPHGTEYVTGEGAVPPIGRAKDVKARLGPFAYEDGQGLDPYRLDLDELIKLDEEDEKRRRDEERLTERVRREVEARMPPPQPSSEETKP